MIRRGLISRDEAISEVSHLEGKIPTSYMGKSTKDILKKIGISLNEFKRICDKFTNKKIFKTDQAGKLIYNDDGNLIRKFDAKIDGKKIFL